jgi:hypothetical protein
VRIEIVEVVSCAGIPPIPLSLVHMQQVRGSYRYIPPHTADRQVPWNEKAKVALPVLC